MAGRGCRAAKAARRVRGTSGPTQPFPSPAGRGTPPTLSAGTPLTRGAIFFVRTFWRRGWIAPQLGLARVAQYDAPQGGETPGEPRGLLGRRPVDDEARARQRPEHRYQGLSSPRGAPRDAGVAGTPLRGPIVPRTRASGIWVPAFAGTTEQERRVGKGAKRQLCRSRMLRTFAHAMSDSGLTALSGHRVDNGKVAVAHPTPAQSAASILQE